MGFIKLSSHWKRVFWVLLCLMAVTALAACSGDDDDEGTIQITNYDNHDYIVDLYRASDNTLYDSIDVQEYPEWGSIDYFEDVEEDTYYMTIRRRGEDVIRAYSRTFELDGGDEEYFVITTEGEIEDN